MTSSPEGKGLSKGGEEAIVREEVARIGRDASLGLCQGALRKGLPRTLAERGAARPLVAAPGTAPNLLLPAPPLSLPLRVTLRVLDEKHSLIQEPCLRDQSEKPHTAGQAADLSQLQTLPLTSWVT